VDKGKTWVGLTGLASLLCALVLAVAVGGAPPWTGKVTLIVFVAAIAVLAVPSLRERRSQREVRTPVRQSATTGSAVAHDSEVVIEMLGTLHSRDIEWMRNESFAIQWRSSRITPFRDIVGRSDIDAPLDGQLYEATRTMIDAVEGFLELYDELTVPDPLVPGDTWREVRGAAAAADGGAGQSTFEKRCRKLRAKAQVAVRAYERLVNLSR
jgi:hypothetical protein